MGLATQGLNVAGKGDDGHHKRLVSMNFLEDAPRIRRNRQLASLNRILSIAIVGVMVFSGSVLGVNTVPAYIETRAAAQLYRLAETEAQQQKPAPPGQQKAAA